MKCLLTRKPPMFISPNSSSYQFMRINYHFFYSLCLVLLVFGGTLFAQETFEVAGRVVPPENASFPETGLTVVLLKFELDAQGKLKTKGPLARIQTQASGAFKFDPVPLQTKAAYQLGSRYQGNLVQSSFFFLKSGQTSINIDIAIPAVSEKVGDLRMINATLFIEANIGQFQVTEVINLSNPTLDIIDTQKNPLIFNLPDSYTNFEPLHQNPEAPKDHELLGSRLQFHRQFPPGDSILIFRYQIPVFFSSYELRRQYRHSFKEGRVLTPVNQLTLASAQLKFTKVEKLGETEMDAWEIISLEKPELVIEVGAIPVQHILYAYSGIAVFAILILLALVFVRLRLK